MLNGDVCTCLHLLTKTEPQDTVCCIVGHGTKLSTLGLSQNVERTGKGLYLMFCFVHLFLKWTETKSCKLEVKHLSICNNCLR